MSIIKMLVKNRFLPGGVWIVMTAALLLLTITNTTAQTFILHGDTRPCPGEEVSYSLTYGRGYMYCLDQGYVASVKYADGSPCTGPDCPATIVGTTANIVEQISIDDDWPEKWPEEWPAQERPATMTLPAATTYTVRVKYGTGHTTPVNLKICFSARCYNGYGSPSDPFDTYYDCIDVTLPAPIKNTPTIVQPNGCQNNGSISLNLVGGTTPYTYQWSTGATSSSISGLAPGNYSVTVTDGDNCVVTYNYTLIGEMNVATSVNKVIPCNATSGAELQVIPLCGTPPFTYTWKKDGSPFGTNSPLQSGLSPGTYMVTVTDANGFTATRTMVVTDPANDAPIAISFTTERYTEWPGHTGCYTKIVANVTGGTPPYTYNWNGVTPADSWRNLPAPGTATLIVTDARGCTKSATISFDCLGIAPNDRFDDILISPNPSGGVITAGVDQKDDGRIKIRVIDLYNNTVFNQDFGFQTAGLHNHSVDISSAPNGAYMLLVQYESEVPVGINIV